MFRYVFCLLVDEGVGKVLTCGQTLQDMRGILVQSRYAQIPQLSVGREMDLNQPLIL